MQGEVFVETEKEFEMEGKKRACQGCGDERCLGGWKESDGSSSPMIEKDESCEMDGALESGRVSGHLRLVTWG